MARTVCEPGLTLDPVSKEPPQYLKTLRPVRALTAACLDARYPTANGPGTHWVTMRKATFKRTNGGPWERETTRRNPAYYDAPGYQYLADCVSTPGKVKVLAVRYDRRAPWGEVSKQMRALAKREGLTGFVGYWVDCHGMDARGWARTKHPRFVWSRGRFVPFR